MILEKTKKEFIVAKIENDVNYIPTLEELRLVGTNFTVGEATIFKLILKNIEDKKVIPSIKEKTKNTRPYGLYELYDQLEVLGYCKSYSDTNIFYVAYTLAVEEITVTLKGFDYRDQLEKKIKAIQELLKKL